MVSRKKLKEQIFEIVKSEDGGGINVRCVLGKLNKINIEMEHKGLDPLTEYKKKISNICLIKDLARELEEEGKVEVKVLISKWRKPQTVFYLK